MALAPTPGRAAVPRTGRLHAIDWLRPLVGLGAIGRYVLTPEIFDILKDIKPGVGGEIQLTDALQRLSKKIGLPVVTAVEPHAIALKALGAKKVALATYFGDELNQAIVNHFARFGLESFIMPGFSGTGQTEALYTTPLLRLDDVSYMDVYRHCKRGIQKLGTPVDAIYINGGGWDAPPAVQLLEDDLKVKVVWAIAAEMWLTYHKLAIHIPLQGCGSLFSGDVKPLP